MSLPDVIQHRMQMIEFILFNKNHWFSLLSTQRFSFCSFLLNQFFYQVHTFCKQYVENIIILYRSMFIWLVWDARHASRTKVFESSLFMKQFFQWSAPCDLWMFVKGIRVVSISLHKLNSHWKLCIQLRRSVRVLSFFLSLNFLF